MSAQEHVLSSIGPSPPLEPRGCPTAVVSVDAPEQAAWVAAAHTRARFLGPPPDPASSIVLQVESIDVINATRMALARYSVDRALDAGVLAGPAQVAARLAQAQRDDRTAPSRLVLFGRVHTGHTVAVELEGFRPGMFVESRDGMGPALASKVQEQLQYHCGKRQGDIQVSVVSAAAMRQVGVGDVAAGPDGGVVRAQRQWLRVTAATVRQLGDVARKLQYPLTLHRMPDRPVLTLTPCEHRVDPGYQVLLSMGAEYGGILHLQGVRAVKRVGDDKEFHTDIECTATVRGAAAWSTPADAPAAVVAAGLTSLTPFPQLVAGLDIEARAERDGSTVNTSPFPKAENPGDSAFASVLSFRWVHGVPQGWTASPPGGIFLRLAFVATPAVPDAVPGVVILHSTSEPRVLDVLAGVVSVTHRPEMIAGFASSHFDLPYLWDRARVTGAARFPFLSARVLTRCVLGEQTLASNQTGSVTERFWGEDTGRERDGKVVAKPAFGLTCLEMQRWARTHFRLERYSLNAVADHTLGPGRGKFEMPYKLLFKAATGTPQDVAKVVAYCAQDTDLVMHLAEAMALETELQQSCRIMCVNAATFLQAQQAKRLYHQLLREARVAGMVINTLPPCEVKDYVGGKVESPIRGLYALRPIMLLDYASMYPNIMISNNLCPSTHVVCGMPAPVPPCPTPAPGTPAHEAAVDRLSFALGWEDRATVGDMLDLATVPDDEALGAALGIPPSSARAMRVVSFHVGKGVCHMFSQGLPSITAPLLLRLTKMRKAGKRTMNAAKGRAKHLSALARLQGAAADPDEAARLRSAAAECTDAARADAMLELARAAACDVQDAGAALADAARQGSTAKTHDAIQKAVKVVMNSVYGACAARQASTFSCPPLAHVTTAIGRHMIQRAQRCAVREFGAQVVYGDTDSVMCVLPTDTLPPGATQAEWIEASFRIGQSMGVRMTAVSGVEMELEAVAPVAVFLCLCKKRYGMRIFESLGEYTKNPLGGQMKLMGSEAVRRDAARVVSATVRAVYTALLAGGGDAVHQATEALRAGLQPLASRTAPVSELTRTGEIKGDYGNGTAVPPQVSIQWQLHRTQQVRPPVSGDRVPFVRVKTAANDNLVPPPAIAACRYRMMVLRTGNTDPNIHNMERPGKKVPDAKVGAHPALPRKRAATGAGGGGACGRGTLQSFGWAARKRSRDPTPKDMALQAMRDVTRAVADEFGCEPVFDAVAARKLWPKDDSESAYYRHADLTDAKDIDYAHYVECTWRGLAGLFDVMVDPSTPIPAIVEGDTEEANVKRYNRYIGQLQALHKPCPSGAGPAVRKARSIAVAAWNKARGVRQLSFAGLPRAPKQARTE